MTGASFSSLAVGLSAASAAQGVVGGVSAARNQRLQLESQARIAQINAGIAETNAKSLEDAARAAEDRGAVEQQVSMRKTSALKGAQRAAMAANGIDLGSDTATDVLTSTDILGAEDVQTIRENTVRSAWGLRTEAVNARTGGAQQQMAANAARGSAAGISPWAVGATSILSGASQVADSWYRVNRGVSIAREG